jgi:hypothetical protein
MRYSIYYPRCNARQEKTLIPHSLWIEVSSINKEKERKDRITALGIFFTDQSPLFEAIGTGVLECNGSWPCIVTPIN